MSSQKVADIIASALRAYDLGDVREIVAVPGEHANRPHRVETDVGRFFVKVLSGRLAAPAVLETRHAFIQHLIEHRVATPAIVPTRSGDTWAAADGGVVEVYEWIDGAALAPGDHCQAVDGGWLLLDLHSAAESFRPSAPGAKRDWLTPDGDLAKLERVEQQVRTYLPAPEVIEQMAYVRHCLTDSARVLAEADLKTHMIHGDFTCANLLLGPKRGLFRSRHRHVTDFDFCHVGPRILDLAVLGLDIARASPDPSAAEARISDVIDDVYGLGMMAQESEVRAMDAALRRVAIHQELERGSSFDRIAALLERCRAGYRFPD